MRVSWGPLLWPRADVALTEIAAARVEDINPIDWGGWGYRVTPRGRAYVVRRGPGLVLERHDRPAIAVTALFAFMSAYNEFILALTFLDDEKMFTLPVFLQRLVGPYGAQWERFAAGSIIVSVPVMALFYYVQRHLVAGLASGGVKG